MTIVSRRRFLAGTAPAAAVGLAAGVVGTARWPLLARGPVDISDPVRLTDFGITGRQEKDMSEAFQAAIDAAAKNGGGVVRCPPGVVWAKGLVVPNNITIEGAGIGASTIKLPDGADTDLIQQSGYAENKTFANLYFGLRDIALDGNKAKNKRGNLVVIRGFRGMLENVRIIRAADHGLLYSEVSADGTSNLNNLAETRVAKCYFDDCDGAGLHGNNDHRNQIADMFVTDSVFRNNGQKGYYQIDLERSAGFHIKGNQMYGAKFGDVRALQAGALIVALNNFDGTDTKPEEGVVRQVLIETRGWGNVVVSSNLFHFAGTRLPEGAKFHHLELVTKVPSAIAVSGNSFRSAPPVESDAVVHRGTVGAHMTFEPNAYGVGVRRPSHNIAR